MVLVSAAQAARNTSGRGGVGVFLQEVVLDLPGVVVAEPVGEHDLLQRLVEQPRLVALVPGLGQLVLVEDPEPHGRPPPPSRPLPALRADLATPG